MEYKHIGWCRDDEANTDKVWGIILLQDNDTNGFGYTRNRYASFWGRRGKKLQTKLFDSSARDAVKMFEKKLDGGYRSVEIDELNTVYPEFQDDLEKTAVWALMMA